MATKSSNRPTLSDVANQAGVAPSTVSYILRKVEPHFSRYAKETIERVQRTADAIGYSPSILATSLRLQRVPHLGIFFEFIRPGDAGPGGGQPSIMWQVYEGIAATARKSHRYPVVLTSPDPDAGLADSPEELDRVVRSGLCGVIAAVHPGTWNDHVARWEDSGVPCISLFNRGEPDRPRWYVDLDNRAVGRVALEYLLSKGHKRIICLHQHGRSQVFHDRLGAFATAKKQDGVDVHVVELSWSREAGGTVEADDHQRILGALQETRSTAIFALDGGATIITHELFANRQIDVPGRCSLIGIDIPFWSDAFRIVTQVACPGRTIGQKAAELLASRINNRSAKRQHILVPPVLQERSSVATL